jgi:hypothetical protein
LEHEVIETLLRPDPPVFIALRMQFAECQMVARKLTGVGFFTDLSLRAYATPAKVKPGRLALGDVQARLEGLQHGAGFVLWIENGLLATLEAFSYDEPWPEVVNEFSVQPATRSGGSETDLEQVERAFDRTPRRSATE